MRLGRFARRKPMDDAARSALSGCGGALVGGGITWLATGILSTTAQVSCFWRIVAPVALIVAGVLLFVWAFLSRQTEDARLAPLRDLLTSNLKVGRDLVGPVGLHWSFWTWRDNTSRFIQNALGDAEAEMFATSELHGQGVSAREGVKLAQPFLGNLRDVLGRLNTSTEIQPDFDPLEWEVDASSGPERKRP